MPGLRLDCSKRPSLAQALENALALRRRQLVQPEQLVHGQHFGRQRRIALAPVAAFPALWQRTALVAGVRLRNEPLRPESTAGFCDIDAGFASREV